MVMFDDPGASAWENLSNPWCWMWVLNGYVIADLDPYLAIHIGS